MCGIIGFFNSSKKRNILLGLQAIRERGKDGLGIFINGKIRKSRQFSEFSADLSYQGMGHVLHSVVGRTLQPIKGKGVLIANCEIYNWKSIKKQEEIIAGNDSILLLKLLDKYGIPNGLQKIKGVYAFAYLQDTVLVICRDLIGIKPLFFSREDGFAFSSEPKGLKALGFNQIEELNPRSILFYDLKKNQITFRGRPFFKTQPLIKSSERQIISKLDELIVRSINLRKTNKKAAVLLSGGVDSALLAKKLKAAGMRFTCYSAGVLNDKGKEPIDVERAREVAKAINLRLKTITIKKSDVPNYLKKIISLVEDSNVVKAGVSLPIFLACEQAKKDGAKVVYSGLGADEIFGGYARQRKAGNLNKECSSSVLKAYEKDTFRDDAIAMYNNLELRLPYYDLDLVNFALRIPSRLKITKQQNKYVLREAAKYAGLPVHIADRKKKAAQYGSNADKAIMFHAKKSGFKTKSSYLQAFLQRPNMRLAALFSGGKDSALAMHIMQKRGYEVSCLISMKSKNPDSYMFHTPNIDLVELQAKAMEIPIIIQSTKGVKEKELADLKKAIVQARKKFYIDGVIVGAIRSAYQRDRVEKVCDKLGLKVFAPLWHMDQDKEVALLIKEGFNAILVSIAAYGLDKSWLGQKINASLLESLRKLKSGIGLNIAGEGGEYESLVLDGPMFKKKLTINDYKIFEESKETAKMQIMDVSLTET